MKTVLVPQLKWPPQMTLYFLIPVYMTVISTGLVSRICIWISFKICFYLMEDWFHFTGGIEDLKTLYCQSLHVLGNPLYCQLLLGNPLYCQLLLGNPLYCQLLLGNPLYCQLLLGNPLYCQLLLGNPLYCQLLLGKMKITIASFLRSVIIIQASVKLGCFPWWKKKNIP